jgi:hypothetical protein
MIDPASSLVVSGLATHVAAALPRSVRGARVGMVLQIICNMSWVRYSAFTAHYSKPVTYASNGRQAFSLQLNIFRVAMGWSWADETESRALISREIEFASGKIASQDV